MTAVNTTITTVMRTVADALKLDGDGKVQESYMKYLECVLRISTKLLQDARLGGNLNVIIGKDTVKMVRLGQQCMERVAAVVTQIDAQSSSLDSIQIQPSYKPSGTKSEPCTPSDQFQSSKCNVFPDNVLIPKEQSPLELAYKQNQQLMMAYKARLARLDPKRRMATDYSLTVQRKMAENLAVAKVQEEALKKKMNERQQRLEEQAARRFGTPTGLTDDDKEQRLIYKKVLEFEQEHLAFNSWRKKLEEKPDDSELINKLIQEITRSNEHPLTLKMKSLQKRLYDKLQHIVNEKINIVDQIKVPLSKSLYPTHHWNKSKEQDNSSEDSKGTSSKREGKIKGHESESESRTDNENDSTGDKRQSENKTDIINDDEVKDTHVPQEMDNKRKSRLEVKEENSDEDEKRDKWEPDYTAETNDISKVQTEVKKDLEKAIDIGEKERDKLRDSIRETKGILHQISQEYDQYNQDNMDELFDDENSDESIEDVKGGEKIQEKSIEIHEEDQNDTGKPLKSSASLSDLKSIEMKIKNLKNEAYQRHIKAISQDIHMYLEKMLVLFTICYEQLDCIEGKDQCYACLEKSIFKPVWRYLLGLFRLANEPKELTLAYVMTERQTCLPADCSVKLKLQMTDCEEPYNIAVKHLKMFPNQQTLLDKLECLVKCSRLVCQCIEDYFKNQKIPSIGADDLLPILCYVIIKAGQPQILSECLILEEFIHEGYIMGEEGYCLTSIQTAVGYLVSQGMDT
ncbi:Hypothetical predicted protein [Mytilus galloprovincialis]|uniref:VPS9 domain-containing protein n=1 Tax=Mytilus galloprovincialis TaxID=29158 RepID=A0A8B6DKS7_MYTGA|nr:Hypothetical predicted protein [Mytilus galloprovincialis]